MPTPISQIPKVEKQNNMATNVFGWDMGVTVNRLSTQPDGMPRINLLLTEEAGKHHFTWINDLNHRLLYDQSKYHGRKHFCERSALLQVRYSAKGPQTRLSRDRADRSQGGDARRGESRIPWSRCSRTFPASAAGRREENQGRASRSKGHEDDTRGLAGLPRS